MKSSAAKFILTALAYIVPTMLLGMVWHFYLFADFYDRLGIYNRNEPIILLGFSSMIIQGLVIAYLYPFFTKGDNSVGKSILFSLVMGIFLFSVSTLANAAKILVSSMQDWLMIQAAFTMVQFLAAGLLIGWVNRRRA